MTEPDTAAGARHWAVGAVRAVRRGTRRAAAAVLPAARRTTRRAARELRQWVYRRTRRHTRAGVWQTTARALAVLLVATTGVILGVLLGGRSTAEVGPFEAKLAVSPSVTGDTKVVIPPLGSLSMDSHDGPVQVTIDLDQLDPSRTQRLVNDPDGMAAASEGAARDIERGMVRLAFQATGAAVLAALLLGALVFRDTRRTAATGVVALMIAVVSLGSAAATFRPRAVEEPRYEGLLSNAPAVVGEARRVADRYQEYRAELQRLVRSVSQLYAAAGNLPVLEDRDTTRVLHISDMHLNPGAWDVVDTVVTQFGIDVVADTGDITDWGREPENQYVAAIRDLEVPYLYVRGNHDSALTEAGVRAQPNSIVLDGSVVQVAGLRFAGIGDPLFTPDKTNEATDANGLLRDAGARLAAIIEASDTSGNPVDMALVHDPVMAGPLAGVVPVVLAGHTHERKVSTIGDGTLLMVEGSTGGAGLRGLQKGEPVPLELSVLYVGPDRKLRAYDAITVGGTGKAEVTLQRHIVDPQPSADPSPSPTNNR